MKEQQEIPSVGKHVLFIDKLFVQTAYIQLCRPEELDRNPVIHGFLEGCVGYSEVRIFQHGD